jgi:hypothetical protein
MVRKSVMALVALVLVVSSSRVAQGQDVSQRIQQLENQMLEMQRQLQALREEQGEEAEEAKKQQQESERRTSVLAEEFERLRTHLTLPERVELKSLYGLGPAASKVYGVERGLSIGGYGEAFYSKFVSDKTIKDRDTSDFLRFVLYAGYKFSDRIILNSEIEFEHGSTSATESAGGGTVSVEFAYLDFLLREQMNARAGMVLVPMGFINEIHEPVFFHGVGRPEVERQIIPSTWRENGIGFFGQLTPELQYRMYAINGFNAKGLRPGGFRDARQHGNRVLAEDIAFVGRFDYTPTRLPGLLLGASVYTGDSGQDQAIDNVELPSANTTLWEVHGQYRAYGLELRGLFTMAHIGEAQELTLALREIGEIRSSDTIASRMLGGYVEVAYDVMPWLLPGTDHYLAPFFRFEYFDTQEKTPPGLGRDASRELRIWTPGLTYKPHPNVALKLDYRNFAPVGGERADELNFGVAFVF